MDGPLSLPGLRVGDSGDVAAGGSTEAESAVLLFEIQSRVSAEVDASLRLAAAMAPGAVRTAELARLIERLVAPLPPIIASLSSRARPDAAPVARFFELLADFYTAALAAVVVAPATPAAARDALRSAEAVEAVELVHQAALPELWSHELLPEVYALAFYAYVSVAPPATDLERMLNSLVEAAQLDEDLGAEGGADPLHVRPGGRRASIAAINAGVHVGEPLRSAAVFVAYDDGAAANRFASVTSGANRLFWRDASDGARTFAPIYAALYHAAASRCGEAAAASPGQRSHGHSAIPRSESVARFASHLSAAAAAWPLPVDAAHLTVLPEWLQRDVILLIYRWFPWYGARDSTVAMLLLLGSGDGVGAPALQRSLAAYAHELSLHVRGLRSEVALLAYVHSLRSGLADVRLDSRTANVIHSALHKLATPGGPVYPSRRVRHSAQAAIDALFPAGRIPRRLVQLCFRLTHPLRWPQSLGHWLASVVWAALVWAAAALRCRRGNISGADAAPLRSSRRRGVCTVVVAALLALLELAWAATGLCCSCCLRSVVGKGGGRANVL